MNTIFRKKEYLIVLIAALGYFVDAYDLILFVVIRKASLIDLGISEQNLSQIGLSLFNTQMVGTFLGGIFFGILGDKKGRLSVLFGSILVYSVANLLNSQVQELWQYYALRFIAGFGLAGELGAGITLVSEVMPQKYRGYGTAIVAATGAAGAFAAGLLGDITPWRYSYFIGGSMGILLLFLRVNSFESSLFKSAIGSNKKHGDFLSLFTNLDKRKRYLSSILISLPIFFTITILMQLAPEVAVQLGIKEEISSGKAVMLVYLGLTLGDLSSGLISQYLSNRKRTIQYFLLFGFVIILFHLNSHGINKETLYVTYVLLGLGAGYWVSLITLTAEQFGTNLRATVATTIPNFARGAVVPIAVFYQWTIDHFQLSTLHAATLTGVICFILAFTATFFIKDTFHKNLDYLD